MNERSERKSAGLARIEPIVRLAFWRAAFWIEKKRRGVTCFHATLAPGADTKTMASRADLYRTCTHATRNRTKGTPIDLNEIL